MKSWKKCGRLRTTTPPDSTTTLGRMFEDLQKKEQENAAPRANLKPVKPAGQTGIGPAMLSSLGCAKALNQIENRKITKAERERLKRIAVLPDNQIDASHIPEVKDRAGWVKVHEHQEHPLHRVLARLLSIRLPEPDIALAQRLAESKGLPYQTYIKSLLHEALERERALAERQVIGPGYPF